MPCSVIGRVPLWTIEMGSVDRRMDHGLRTRAATYCLGGVIREYSDKT